MRAFKGTNVNTTSMFNAGLSSGAKASLFYAAGISNVPAVFMAEPDDLAILSGQALHRSSQFHHKAVSFELIALHQASNQSALH